MELFKHIGRRFIPNQSDFPPEIESDIYFSDVLMLYIEVYNGNDYMLYKPIEHINDIDDITCQKIREQLSKKTTEGIEWIDLFYADYVNLYLLDGPQPTEEDYKRETVFEMLGESFKP